MRGAGWAHRLARQATRQPWHEQLADRLRQEHPGLRIDLHRSGEYVVLSRIQLPREGRNRGVGTRAMRELVAQADRNGTPLALSPSADFGGNVARLKRFYRRYGFVPNTGRSRDLTVSETMIRPVGG